MAVETINEKPKESMKTLLPDELWQKLEPLLPEQLWNGGRMPVGNRKVFEGILWLLKSGVRWKNMPRRYPSYATCWRRLQDWEQKGIWNKVWRKYLAELDDQRQLDWEKIFTDGSFAKVKSGWWWQTANTSLAELVLIRQGA